MELTQGIFGKTQGFANVVEERPQKPVLMATRTHRAKRSTPPERALKIELERVSDCFELRILFDFFWSLTIDKW